MGGCSFGQVMGVMMIKVMAANIYCVPTKQLIQVYSVTLNNTHKRVTIPHCLILQTRQPGTERSGDLPNLRWLGRGRAMGSGLRACDFTTRPKGQGEERTWLQPGLGGE